MQGRRGAMLKKSGRRVGGGKGGRRGGAGTGGKAHVTCSVYVYVSAVFWCVPFHTTNLNEQTHVIATNKMPTQRYRNGCRV